MMLQTHDHPACWPEDRLLAECRWQRTRGSGPGGQHRNKVETAVQVTHLPTDIRAAASERRSQHANRRLAIDRLRRQLAVDVRRSVACEPSLLWQRRVSGGRIQIRSDHADFPALLAEVLDALEARRWNVRETAEWLSISLTQLVRFLKLEPRAFTRLNDIRRQQGQRPFH